jgi:hypothetical protein
MDCSFGHGEFAVDVSQISILEKNPATNDSYINQVSSKLLARKVFYQ